MAIKKRLPPAYMYASGARHGPGVESGLAHGGPAGGPSSAQAALSVEVRPSSVFLASPSTIIVFGLTNSSFSTPAKPGLSERLRTIDVRAFSTLNTGMPWIGLL